jgi:hypothetical protein
MTLAGAEVGAKAKTDLLTEISKNTSSVNQLGESQIYTYGRPEERAVLQTYNPISEP